MPAPQLPLACAQALHALQKALPPQQLPNEKPDGPATRQSLSALLVAAPRMAATQQLHIFAQLSDTIGAADADHLAQTLGAAMVNDVAQHILRASQELLAQGRKPGNQTEATRVLATRLLAIWQNISRNALHNLRPALGKKAPLLLVQLQALQQATQQAWRSPPSEMRSSARSSNQNENSYHAPRTGMPNNRTLAPRMASQVFESGSNDSMLSFAHLKKMQPRLQTQTAMPKAPMRVVRHTHRHIGKVHDFFLPNYRVWLRSQGISFVFRRLNGKTTNWLRSEAIFTGTFGKVSMGRELGKPNGQKVAIKELRTQTASNDRPARLTGKEKTRAVDPQKALAEIERTRIIRATIESEVAGIEQALWPNNNPLDVVRTGQQPSVIYDSFEDTSTKKMYMVSTLELGGTDSLLKTRPADLTGDLPLLQRDPLATSFAAQAFVELAAMHDHAAMAHLDLKLDNVSYNGFGQFKLADFGLARPTRDDGKTNLQGMVGTIVAPEMLLFVGEDPLREKPLSQKVDIYALAASTLQLIAGYGIAFPFYPQRTPGEKTVDTDATAARCVAIENYLRGLQPGLKLPKQADGNVDFARLPVGPDPVVQQFFFSCIRRAPQLTEAMLPALQFTAAQRPDAKTMALAAAAHLPQAGSAAQRQLQDYFAQRENEGIYQKVFQDADKFETLLRQQGVTPALAAPR